LCVSNGVGGLPPAILVIMMTSAVAGFAMPTGMHQKTYDQLYAEAIDLEFESVQSLMKLRKISINPHF